VGTEPPPLDELLDEALVVVPLLLVLLEAASLLELVLMPVWPPCPTPAWLLAASPQAMAPMAAAKNKANRPSTFFIASSSQWLRTTKCRS